METETKKKEQKKVSVGHGRTEQAITVDQFKAYVNDKLAQMTPEQKESYRLGNVRINLAFILMEGCDWLLREGENELKACGQCQGLRFDVKRDFKMMMRNLMMTRTMLKDFACIVYKLEEADNACEDSDEIMDMITTYIDRAGEDRELGLKIRSMVKNSYPSKHIFERRTKA